MGLCSSAYEERYAAAVNGKVDRLFIRLRVDDSEGRKWFSEFEQIAGGAAQGEASEINLDEFFDRFELDWSRFGQRIFMVFDSSGEKRLDFAEFFTGMWNYCTLEDDTLIKFAFDMFDIDQTGSLDRIEVRKLVRMCQGKKSLDSDAEKILKKLDQDGSGDVTLAEFQEMVKNTRSLLFPAFKLQRDMREKFLGNSYWDEATKRRAELITGRSTGKDLIALRWELYNRGQKYDRAKIWAQAEERKEGIIKHDQSEVMTVPVYNKPAKDGRVLRKLNMYDTIDLLEEVKGDENGPYWRIGMDQFVAKKYVKRDATWDKQKREQDDLKKERDEDNRKRQAKMDELEARKKKVFTEWIEKKDDQGRVFWFNQRTMETRQRNPFEGKDKLW